MVTQVQAASLAQEKEKLLAKLQQAQRESAELAASNAQLLQLQQKQAREQPAPQAGSWCLYFSMKGRHFCHASTWKYFWFCSHTRQIQCLIAKQSLRA